MEWNRRTAGLYGRREPECEWVAFGDDAAASSGLVAAMDALHGEPLFCGDAVADPLAGVQSAVAALDAWSRGDGVLLDISLAEATRYVLSQRSDAGTSLVRRCDTIRERDAWEVVAGGKTYRVAPPRARQVTVPARELGADTAAVIAELAQPC